MILLIIWLLVTLPIIYEVNKQTEISLFAFPIVLIMATLKAPEYYYYLIKELITTKK
jgi:uncharacterized membrane protein